MGGIRYGAKKADAIVEVLRVKLEQLEVKITHLCKIAKLRVSGLENSVTSEDVAGALAVADVRVGAIRTSFNGLGTA